MKQQEDVRFVEVDGYLIPYDELDTYKERRLRLEQRARAAMLTFASRVEKGGEGSEDGAFLIGILDDGEYHGFLHLDPETVDRADYLTDGELAEELELGS